LVKAKASCRPSLTTIFAAISFSVIRLQQQPTWAINPPRRTIFTVAKVDFRAGPGNTGIVSVEGLHFAPWEVERHERE